MISIVPLLDGNLGRPRLTGIVRTTRPPSNTCICLVSEFTFISRPTPILKSSVMSERAQRPPPRVRPAESSVTCTLLPGAQYVFGRKCSSRLFTQPHAPVVAGVERTVSIFSNAARCAVLRTGLLNLRITGIPMPYVLPSPFTLEVRIEELPVGVETVLKLPTVFGAGSSGVIEPSTTSPLADFTPTVTSLPLSTWRLIGVTGATPVLPTAGVRVNFCGGGPEDVTDFGPWPPPCASP